MLIILKYLVRFAQNVVSFGKCYNCFFKANFQLRQLSMRLTQEHHVDISLIFLADLTEAGGPAQSGGHRRYSSCTSLNDVNILKQGGIAEATWHCNVYMLCACSVIQI